MSSRKTNEIYFGCKNLGLAAYEQAKKDGVDLAAHVESPGMSRVMVAVRMYPPTFERYDRQTGYDNLDGNIAAYNWYQTAKHSEFMRVYLVAKYHGSRRDWITALREGDYVAVMDDFRFWCVMRVAEREGERAKRRIEGGPIYEVYAPDNDMSRYLVSKGYQPSHASVIV